MPDDNPPADHPDDTPSQRETSPPLLPVDPPFEHTMDMPPQAAGRSGQKIGPCTLRRLIGRGGMGAVYEAIQENPRRTVAVKLMRRGITSKTALRRFEFESQILARLRHPGIAQVYEAGTHHEDVGVEDTPFFVMEYIPGALPITEFANKHDLPVRDRMKLFLQVCEAVQHGHLKGIVHRDLKPSNILIASNGKPKIIDFGVARSTDSDLALTTQQTDIGQILGTVQYMSPEQCEADPNDIDTRSDVYALGVVLHELLTGQLPYDLSTAQLHEAIRIVCEQIPTRLSSIDRRLKGDLEVITGKAMEKERWRRYQTAAALSEDIGHWLDDEPINAKPPGAFDSVARFARRHTAAFTAIASVFVVLIIAVAVIATIAIEANTQREIAQAAQTQEHHQREQADAAKNFLTTMISSIDPATAGNLDKQLLVHTLTHAADQLGTDFAAQPLLEAELRGTIGESFHTLGMYQDADRHLRRAVELLQANERGDNALMRRFLIRRARTLREAGQHELALELAQEHLEWVLAAHESNLETAVAFQTISMICIDTLSFDRAHTALNQAREIYATLPPSADEVHFLFISSQLVQVQGLLPRAEELAKQALASNELLPNPSMTEQATIRYHLGILMAQQGKFDDAASALEETLKLNRGLYGDNHPHTLKVLGTLGSVHAAAGNLDLAEPCLRQVYKGQLSALGAEHNNTLMSMGNLGMLLGDQGKLDAAQAVLEPALAITLRVNGPDHPATQQRRRFLAYLRSKQGRLQEAVELLTLAAAGMNAAYGPAHRISLQVAEELELAKAEAEASTANTGD